MPRGRLHATIGEALRASLAIRSNCIQDRNNANWIIVADLCRAELSRRQRIARVTQSVGSFEGGAWKRTATFPPGEGNHVLRDRDHLKFPSTKSRADARTPQGFHTFPHLVAVHAALSETASRRAPGMDRSLDEVHTSGLTDAPA